MAVASTTRRGPGFVKVSPDEVHGSLARHILADGYPFVYDHRRSEGSYLLDAASGRKYIDFFSFFASSPLTHNHPKVNTPEFRAKMADIAIINPANSDVYTVEMAEAVETFAQYAIPRSMPHLFFISGGAPAVENALKVAFDWKVRKNLGKGLPEERGSKVLHFKEAFHGRLGYTLSLTNTADPRKHMYFPKFAWPRVENPKLVFPLTDSNLERTREAERNSLAEIEAAFDANTDDIACILIEPIQCEGGDNHFRPEFLKELRRIADERDAMLIFDEVQTGMGMCGAMWAHQSLDVEPDIIVFGKKTQVCGIAASSRVDEVERNVFVESSRINSTWGGSITDMVRGQRYIEIIHEDDLLNNACVQGEYLVSSLRHIEGRGAAIGNVRGRGLLVAFDVADTPTRDGLLNDALNAGLILLACGGVGIRVRPHLDVKRETVDEALNILESVAPRR